VIDVSKITEKFHTLDGISLTLSQINDIATMATTIGEGDRGWAISRMIFKSNHVIRDDEWVIHDAEEAESFEAYVEKQADGTYRITAVSTADLPDREGDTFGTEAIDYDMQAAKRTNSYPEFRVFHRKELAIGKVDNMRRVGIFAVDEGDSYTDPFSLSVCEKMLAGNDGKWRVSRGFFVEEISGGCPVCKESMVITKQHMIAGFNCPSCGKTFMTYRKSLDGVRFRKARTFDVTITDIPCVPWTGVSAMKITGLEDLNMNKKELKEKLLKAGIAEEDIDARLKSLTDEQLKEFDGIPDAVLLKEFKKDEEEDEAETFVLDPAVLKDFTDIVEKAVTKIFKEMVDGLSIDVGDIDLSTSEEFKEISKISQIAEDVAELKEAVASLLEKDEKRLKELVRDVPRGAKLRIVRHKAADEEDEEGMTDEETDEEETPSKNGKKPWIKKALNASGPGKGAIVGADGGVSANMTEFVFGGGAK